MQRSEVPNIRSTRGHEPTIAIVGAGVSGIATAVKLKRAGFSKFTVFEQSAGPGGTWFDNTYPGCEVDIHSHFYSFSFMAHDWTRTHATQPELLQYIEDTVDHFGIRDHFQFNTRVDEVAWDDALDVYHVTFDTGETRDFTMVVSCLGLLSFPKYPDWPGMDEFRGPMFHTSRWEHEHDLRGKNVAFVGTGSTGSQAVPAIAPIAKSVTVYQRQPGWVIPKGDREFTPTERARYRRYAIVRAWQRFKQFRNTHVLVKGLWREGTALNSRLRETSLAYIDSEIDDPETRKAVTPDFPFGCKRTIQDSQGRGFYAALNRDNVELVPHEVQRLTATGVVADGVERPADVVILGTGFQPQNFLASMRVVGLGGRSIHDVWGETPMAFVGVTVPGFPNFFMVYGPNTNGGGSIIYQNEKAAEMVVRMAKRLRRGASKVDTRPRAYETYVRVLDRIVATRLTAQLHCHNYYYSPTGRNVTQYPGSHLSYHLATMLLPIIGVKSYRGAPTSAPAEPARQDETIKVGVGVDS